MPLAEKVKSGILPKDKTSSAITAKTGSVKAAKDSLTGTGKSYRPAGTGMSGVSAATTDSAKTMASRSSDVMSKTGTGIPVAEKVKHGSTISTGSESVKTARDTSSSSGTLTRPTSTGLTPEKMKPGSIISAGNESSKKTRDTPSNTGTLTRPTSTGLTPEKMKSGSINSAGNESVKTARDTPAGAGALTRPVSTGKSVRTAGTAKSSGVAFKSQAVYRPVETKALSKEGDVRQKGGNISQSQSNPTNITVQQKVEPQKHNLPEATKSRDGLSKPATGIRSNISKVGGNEDNYKAVTSEAIKSNTYSGNETAASAHDSSIPGHNAKNTVNVPYKNADRSEITRQNYAEASKPSGVTGSTVKNSEAKSSKTINSASTTNNAGITNTTLSKTGISTSKPPSVSRQSPSRPNIANKTSPGIKNNTGSTVPVSHTKTQIDDSSAAHMSQKQTQISFGTNKENREKLRNRPPYKSGNRINPAGNKREEYR